MFNWENIKRTIITTINLSKQFQNRIISDINLYLTFGGKERLKDAVEERNRMCEEKKKERTVVKNYDQVQIFVTNSLFLGSLTYHL